MIKRRPEGAGIHNSRGPFDDIERPVLLIYICISIREKGVSLRINTSAWIFVADLLEENFLVIYIGKKISCAVESKSKLTRGSEFFGDLYWFWDSIIRLFRIFIARLTVIFQYNNVPR